MYSLSHILSEHCVHPVSGVSQNPEIILGLSFTPTTFSQSPNYDDSILISFVYISSFPRLLRLPYIWVFLLSHLDYRLLMSSVLLCGIICVLWPVYNRRLTVPIYHFSTVLWDLLNKTQCPFLSQPSLFSPCQLLVHHCLSSHANLLAVVSLCPVLPHPSLAVCSSLSTLTAVPQLLYLVHSYCLFFKIYLLCHVIL